MTTTTSPNNNSVGGWNVNAREFTPSTALSSPAVSPNNLVGKLRVEAPVFVPLTTSLKFEVREIIQSAGIGGIRIKDIPRKFYEKRFKEMDLSSCPYSDLTLLVASIDDVTLIDDVEEVRSMSEAMMAAGFYVSSESTIVTTVNSNEESSSEESPVLLGVDANKIAKMSIYNNFVEDLVNFKESILDVAYNFALKNGTHPGLALSLFAAEWDRYHSARGIPADLRSLRERFGVVKLMPFLQAIPDLDIVGTHPEVRVRIKEDMKSRAIAPSPKRKMTAWYPTTPSPNTSTNEGGVSFIGGGIRNLSLVSELGLTAASENNLSLNSELFGSTPEPIQAPEAHTRTVLEQMLHSTQSQILEILSHVPPDPLAAAAAIEKMNELQVLVNALKAALAVLPTPVAAKKQPISIESALFGSSASSKRTLNLESMLDDTPSSSPVAAASSAGPQVGPLLSDLSRILFSQVIQQQQPTAPEIAFETNAALERTLAEIISAASSPPASPVSIGGTGDSLVSGQLIIPNSLPSSPIQMSTTPITDDAATMHQLLKGLMGVFPPPEPEPLMYSKQVMLSVRNKMKKEGELDSPPKEIAGLCCRQVLRTVPVRATTTV